MARLQIRPICRVEAPGDTAKFRVRFNTGGTGEAETLTVRASAEAVGYKAHFAGGQSSVTLPVKESGEAQVLEVEVPGGASMA